MFEIVGREEQVFEQWEQGVSLSNPCMKAGDEVVFRNASGATYVMIAGASGVEVPNRLLQMTCNILVDLEQGNEQHSDCQTVFEVNPADKPDDYVFIDNTIRKEAQASGGGGRFDVHLNEDTTVDKTFSEIKTAYDAGMVVCLIVPNMGVIAHASSTPDDEYGIRFTSVTAMYDGNVFFTNYFVNADSTVDVMEVSVSGSLVDGK